MRRKYSEMIAPLQRISPINRKACHGVIPGSASKPPTINGTYDDTCFENVLNNGAIPQAANKQILLTNEKQTRIRELVCTRLVNSRE